MASFRYLGTGNLHNITLKLNKNLVVSKRLFIFTALNSQYES